MFTRRYRALPSCLGVALGSLLASSVTLPARADAPSAEAAADARLSEAKQKFQEGVRAFNERRYADAVQAFRVADGIEPSPALSFNIARSYERLADVPAALRWYRDYLRRSPTAANAAEVQTRVHELALQLAARGVQQLSVLVEPLGARLSIDEHVVGVAPFTTELAPGAHHLSVRAAGYRDVEQDFVLEAGTPQDLSLKLEPQASVGPAPVAASTTKPSPPSPSAAAPPAAAPPAAAPPVAASKARPFGVVPWIVLGAGAASTLTALGFELSRRSAETDAKNSAQLDYPGHFEAMHSRQSTARVLAVLGGGLLVTGGVLFVLNTPKKSAPRLALGCTGSGCSLAASGSLP